MTGFRAAIAAACIAAAGAAHAQGVRTSSFHANSSMTFHRYFEPFPRVNAAAACRDICIRDRRCTGWTWYQDTYANETLRRACILGAGLKSSKIGDRPGRFAGIISVR